VIEIEIVCVELGVTVSDDGIDMEKSGWGGGVEDWLDEPPSELLEPPQPNIKTTAKNPKNPRTAYGFNAATHCTPS
jgi:hypothetical protein